MPLIEGARDVREIDVIAVELDRDPHWGGWDTVPGDVIGTWEDERVHEVLGLVAALPEAEGMRCFVPSYAIRLRRGWSTLAEVAFCFQCHNGLLLTSGIADTDMFTFDPDSKPAVELLRRFRALRPPTDDAA
ncbi:hypothetical protein OG792_28595 [Micromonospora sp. NBC_01699]|uniref:hypothetical protein n=1 Tax=Micromonospora sp. NBC_01699 TaxID=2975984 RepID=UPI002E2A6A5F|nr:hypothetical protein [Micromonospora sp. NBC_01699]